MLSKEERQDCMKSAEFCRKLSAFAATEAIVRLLAELEAAEKDRDGLRAILDGWQETTARPLAAELEAAEAREAKLQQQESDAVTLCTRLLDERDKLAAERDALKDQLQDPGGYLAVGGFVEEINALRTERDALREQLEGCRARLRFHLGEDRPALGGEAVSDELKTDSAISERLNSGFACAVVGLNKRGLVQLQLPPGNDYIVLSSEQAKDLARCLVKHARRAALEGKPC